MKITSDFVCQTKHTYFASHWFRSLICILAVRISINFSIFLFFLEKSIIKSVFRSLLLRKRFSCKWNLGCILIGIHSRKALKIFRKIFLLLKWLLITNNMSVDLQIFFSRRCLLLLFFKWAQFAKMFCCKAVYLW